MRTPRPKNILVIDIGGSNIKLAVTGRSGRVKLPSGPAMTAGQMARKVLAAVAGWKFDAVSIGFPGPVKGNRPAAEPHNLGGGWCRFDFGRAFGRPVRMINDAAMQALAHARPGRVLFVGLGTGFGSALVEDGRAIPLELCQLRYSRQQTVEEVLGKRGAKTLGPKRWEEAAHEAIAMLQAALIPDVTVVGGGCAKKLVALPPGCVRGENADAFKGGFQLWAGDPPRGISSPGPSRHTPPRPARSRTPGRPAARRTGAGTRGTARANRG
jgi:polyphosphate glucokinase